MLVTTFIALNYKHVPMNYVATNIVIFTNTRNIVHEFKHGLLLIRLANTILH